MECPLQETYHSFSLKITPLPDESDRIDFGSACTETDYIFVWSDGKPFRPDYITRAFKKVLAQHGLP